MANRKISDLVALTTPASGDYLPIVDISEAAAADKNKRITIEELMRGVPDGTAAAPGISFDGDNTGIYRPGTDQVAISTNGTGRLFVDASGRIGIGNTSPSARFDLHTGATGDLMRFGVDATTYADFSYTSNTFTLAANASKSLAFETGGNERMRITSDGNVGVGVTPVSALHVNTSGATTLRVSTSSSSAEPQIVLIDTSASDYFSFQKDGQAMTFKPQGAEVMRITSAGRLLVGTASNSGGALLQINGDRIRVGTAKTPASATDTGTAGEICWDANYVYVCTATNTWKRSALSTW